MLCVKFPIANKIHTFLIGGFFLISILTEKNLKIAGNASCYIYHKAIEKKYPALLHNKITKFKFVKINTKFNNFCEKTVIQRYSAGLPLSQRDTILEN